MVEHQICKISQTQSLWVQIWATEKIIVASNWKPKKNSKPIKNIFASLATRAVFVNAFLTFLPLKQSFLAGINSLTITQSRTISQGDLKFETQILPLPNLEKKILPQKIIRNLLYRNACCC